MSLPCPARRFLAALPIVCAAASLLAQPPEEAAPPPRSIPGITAADPFPRACVDCHVNRPEIGLDVRLSTLMKRWNEAVDPRLLERARAAGGELTGRHPAVPEALADMPAACLGCHSRQSTTAPPFARMMHSIHLTGGEENHFLTLFQGECTHCHKLEEASGAWRVPSGPER